MTARMVLMLAAIAIAAAPSAALADPSLKRAGATQSIKMARLA